MTTNESDMPIVTDAVANAQENLSIDTTQALEMLTLLGYTDDEVVYARKLPRKVKPKPKGFKKDQRAEKFTFKLSSIPTTQTYDEAVYIVVNGQGQSKFVMDNDGKPTSQRLINHGRALFIEFDGTPKESQKKVLEWLKSLGFPEPTLIIETRNSLHVYWVFTEKVTIDEWEKLQEDTIKFVPECDPSIKDAPRLMRLAGCYHTQINGETGEVLEPFRCDIIGGSKEKYDFETLRKLVPIHIKPEKKANPPQQPTLSRNTNQIMSDSERDRRLALEILSQFPESKDGDNNYPMYREIAVVLKNVVGESEAISTMENHSPNRNWQQIITSSNGSHNIGTLHHYVKELDPQWDYPDWWKKSFPKNNVVSINKNNPKANESSTLSDDLKALLDEGLSGSELDSKILSLAKLYKHTKKDVKDLYDKLSNEKERELELDFQKEVLDKLENQKVVKLNEVLPENFAKPLAAIAKAYGVSESVFVTCLLPVVCSQLDPDMQLLLRPASNQRALPIFWSVIVGDPGTGKTPTVNLFTNPIKKLQKLEKDRFDLDYKDYEKRYKEWEKLNKKEKQSEPEPEPPEPMKRYWIDKTTTEAMLKVQAQNTGHSILCARDELSEFINELGQYKGGKGSDTQVVLTMRNGGATSRDLVNGYSYIERSTISITGGIQPGVLKKHMGNMQDEDGFFSRFVFDFIPSDTPNKIEEGEIIPDVSEWLDRIYSHLRTIPAKTFTFEDEAQKKYNQWYNALDDKRINEPRGAMKGIYAKCKTFTGEIALALHCLWAAIEGQSPSNKVSCEALYAAKKMINLYLSNIKTFYQTASEDETAPLERILALSAKTDDYISATEVKQRDRFFKKISPDTIRAYFTDLTLMGKGEVTGKGKAIRFKKLDTFKGNLTENRQKLDRVKNSQNLTTTTVSEIISTKLDKLDNFSQANSENEPSPPVVIPDEVLPTKENVYLSSESPQPQTQQASQPLDTVSSSVYSSQDLSSNRSNQKDIWDDDYEVSDNQKTNNFKAGDRVRYSGTYGMVEATIKNIKTVSDQGNPLSCPLAVLDNETAIPLQQLTAIA